MLCDTDSLTMGLSGSRECASLLMQLMAAVKPSQQAKAAYQMCNGNVLHKHIPVVGTQVRTCGGSTLRVLCAYEANRVVANAFVHVHTDQSLFSQTPKHDMPHQGLDESLPCPPYRHQ